MIRGYSFTLCGSPATSENRTFDPVTATVREDENTVAFHAGTTLKNGKTVTNGGRVLGITSVAPTLQPAIMRAYEGVNKIHFEGMYCRRDIASKGLTRN
ncbi:MAG: hypothetical protein IH790_02420 [Acidobacteria bacterium]|nr:hypothetical protein [Acidobacteriota bacterium]